jgi:telomere length regulation protein
MALRSSAWMNAISNRLAATNQRVRFLGILVGEALSGLVDKEDKRLNFKIEETEQAEGKWYKGLVRVSDDVGPLGPLQRLSSNQPQPKPQPQQKPQKPTPKPAPQRQQQPKSGLIIEELSDGEPPEEDDIVPYAKPDSDPEDSDDDPTLIRRDKPKAPVYIRELIRYLRDSDNYDHQKLALTTAPTLIRRKADYGTEVAEHAEEIASLLVGLSDKFKMESFDEMRLQGMIALVVAKPEKMGPWIAKTFFEGDYSISQRASILAVLGMGARELAGLETSNYASAAAFPSKTLPERVERLYLEHNTLPSGTQSNSLKSLPKNALENITSSLTDAWLAPLAAKAADAAAGPDVLKLSTFSSRLNKEHDGANNQQQQHLLENPKIKYTTKSRPRQRAIPNTTAHLIATSFFSPLIARFQAALHSTTSSAISSARFHTAVSHPHLLSLYLQTLALLLHAAGPGTLALPSMTAELWRLLLGARVRAAAVGDLAVTRAVLFGFLALLDVNEDRARDVCAELGREVVEAMEWVGAVFGGLRGGDEAGEEEGVKALAAGVLVRLKEAVEKYQLVMVGDLIGFG